MLTVAFVVLAAAVALGSVLAVLYLGGRTAPAATWPPWPPWPLSAAHGLLGIGGLCCLALALGGSLRGADRGVASFGAIAAVLLAMAALAGIGVLMTHRLRRRRAGTLLGLRAMLAVGGFVVLAAYLLV
jgi:hypothetical protein